MSFIFEGIKGLAQTISVQKKVPSQELRKQFKVPENDQCVDDFNCALLDRHLLQGNLYIYKTRLCFHSLFNKKSIIGTKGTIISISYEEIELVKKEKNLIFDNSIEITTLNGSHFFTSFLSRGKAFKLISFQWKQYKENLLPQLSSNNLLNKLNQMNSEIQLMRQEIIAHQNKQCVSPIQIESTENQSELNSTLQSYQTEVENLEKNIFQEKEIYQGIISQEQEVNRNNESLPNNDVSNQIIIEKQLEPLEFQKSLINLCEDQINTNKPLFDQRSNAIQHKIVKEFASATFSEITIHNISSREFFSLFFSSQQYKPEKLNKTFNSFYEYYISEYLHGTKLSISEIFVPPPEIYNSMKSNNYVQLLEYPEFSERQMSFTNLLQNTSVFLPKSLQCTIKEKIYWQSPQAFTLVRQVSLNGIPMTGNIEPRIVYFVEEVNGSVTLKSGYYVHFKSSQLFRNKIEQISKDENEKSWKEFKNIIHEVSSDFIQKRDKNKQIEQQENLSTLQELNPNLNEECKQDNDEEFKQSNDEDIKKNEKQNKEINEQKIYYTQQQYDEEIINANSLVSNSVCSIF